MITDIKTKHVLSILPIELKKEEDVIKGIGDGTDIKLVVGLYAKYIKTFDLMESSVGSRYVFMDQKESDVSFQEKPGISCLHSLKVGAKTLLAQGGFDQRVRLLSAKTLKLLINLKFHDGIVNRVHVENAQD